MAEMSNSERIGFHKGALDCLIKEREEFVRLLSIVEQLMALHIKALKELGVDVTKRVEPAKKSDDKLDEVL
jgi:hypothetical protein